MDATAAIEATAATAAQREDGSMPISRRRIAALLSGGVLITAALMAGLFQAATATAAGDTTACIAALRSDRTAALHLAGSWLAAYNATAAGSALSKADDKYLLALKESRDDYFKAYTYAYKGQKTTANSWVKKGNAAIARANAAVRAYNAEIAKINAMADAASMESNALQTQIAATDATCLGL
jgi:hypothetical protein